MSSIFKSPLKKDEQSVAQAIAPDIPPVKWTKSPGLRKLYFYAAVLCIASATTGYDGSMINSMQYLPSWQQDMNITSGTNLGLLAAMYNIGSIASLAIVPFLTDRYGRKISIISGCVIMIIAASVQASAQGLSQFEAGRFFMGFGNSLAQLASPMLLTEICHPQHRARVTAVYNCLWNVGAIICAWISYGTEFIPSSWAWRTPTLIQAFPSVIQLMFIWWVPESPRWYVYMDRNEDALNMLAKYHADGNANDPIVQFEFAEIKETIRLEFLAKKTSSYLDFFKSKGTRYRLVLILSLGLFSQWSGNALFSYYSNIIYTANGITGTQSGLGLNGGNTILSLIVSISCAFLIDKVGRRPLFLIATTGMLCFFTGATIAGSQYSKTHDKGTGIAVILFFWLHGVAYATAWSGLLVAYTVEILPFKLRAKGLVIMNLSVQVALAINSQVNPIPIGTKDHPAAWYNTPWKLYACYTGWIFLELIFVYFLYVETKGPTLEEIARIFDGENAEVGSVAIKEVPGLSNDRFDDSKHEEMNVEVREDHTKF